MLRAIGTIVAVTLLGCTLAVVIGAVYGLATISGSPSSIRYCVIPIPILAVLYPVYSQLMVVKFDSEFDRILFPIVLILGYILHLLLIACAAYFCQSWSGAVLPRWWWAVNHVGGVVFYLFGMSRLKELFILTYMTRRIDPNPMSEVTASSRTSS